MKTCDVIDELRKLEHLIEIEQEEDLRIFTKLILETPLKEKKEKGITWYPVVITKENIGLGGRLFIEVKTPMKNANKHVFSTGAVVSLFADKKRGKNNPFVNAVVVKIEQNNMEICLNEEELPSWTETDSLGIDLGHDEKTFLQMKKAVKNVIFAENNRLAELRNIILGAKTPEFEKLKLSKISEQLNFEQKQATKNVLQAKDVAIIHGPPGTGKTTTLVSCICTTLEKEKQVLVCAPSNAAVDLLLLKLLEKNLSTLRLGHPARIKQNLLENTIDAKIMKHPEYKLLKKWRKQALEIRAQAVKFHKHFDSKKRQERKEKWQEVRSLFREIKTLEYAMCNNILDNTQVIVSTLTGAGNDLIRNRNFPVVFIDEAAQALEGACWIPISKSQKVIFAGDHHQLPPTVKSIEADRQGFGKTLMEKCISRHNIDIMLQIQYRMHEEIMSYSNEVFYKNELKAHPSVATRVLGESFPALEFIDTAGCDYEEECNLKNNSRYNPGEAKIIITHLLKLIADLKQENQNLVNLIDVGLISPYKEQVYYLKEESFKSLRIYESLKNRFSINTIDSFQGQERDIIYISLVRSNENCEIGFLKDIRRMNVAMTRAKQKLVIVGDSATLSSHDFYANFIEYTQKISAYTSVWELGYQM